MKWSTVSKHRNSGASSLIIPILCIAAWRSNPSWLRIQLVTSCNMDPVPLRTVSAPFEVIQAFQRSHNLDEHVSGSDPAAHQQVQRLQALAMSEECVCAGRVGCEALISKGHNPSTINQLKYKWLWLSGSVFRATACTPVCWTSITGGRGGHAYDAVLMLFSWNQKQQCQPCRKRPQRRRRPHLRTCNLLLVEFLDVSCQFWLRVKEQLEHLRFWFIFHHRSIVFTCCHPDVGTKRHAAVFQ